MKDNNIEKFEKEDNRKYDTREKNLDNDDNNIYELATGHIDPQDIYKNPSSKISTEKNENDKELIESK